MEIDGGDFCFGLKLLKLTVQPKDIYYISWNIDASEGLGFLKTEDAARGKVTVFTPLSLLDDMMSMIEGLRREGIAIGIDEVCDYLAEG